jgi:hypothetical protein
MIINISMFRILIRTNMEKLTYKNKTKEVITILMDSRFYFAVPLSERYLLIKKIIEEYHFLSKQ